MNRPKICSIIVPIYNEEAALHKTISHLLEITSSISHWGFEIICVNDGSKDRSGEILREINGIRVIHHEINRGYGAALRSGLLTAKSDWIFIIDADGTYPLQDLPRLLNAANEDIGMVVGSRMGIGINAAPHKRIARWLLRKMVQSLTGVLVPDLNSGMRIFKRQIFLEFQHLLPYSFSFTTTITVASLYTGYRIHFLPIQYDHRVGKSNIRPLKDFFGFTMLIIRVSAYFEPLRFFLPISAFFFLLGIAKGIRDFIIFNSLGSLVIIFLMLSLQTFMMGVLADVIVKRAQANYLPRLDP